MMAPPPPPPGPPGPPGPPPRSVITPLEFNGYGVAFSPFHAERLAVAAAQNFGIIGNGRQYVLEMDPAGGCRIVGAFDSQDGLYDCRWSEANENVLISASGDGSVKVWDVALPPEANPVYSCEEHKHEVYSLSWNPNQRTVFLSGSWDDSIKLWNQEHLPRSVRTFAEHTYCVYNVEWNPTHAEVFCSVSGDCTARVWDVRQPQSVLGFRAHNQEALSCSWNKYDTNLLVTGSVDRTVKLWDLRNTKIPAKVCLGHQYAVRRVCCSPFSSSQILSCSYDMTVCLWDISMTNPANPNDEVIPVQRSWNHHTEFVVGIDMSVLTPGLVASTGWDEKLCVWSLDAGP